jgi:2-polyprenyl-3-methyl-5-hydroxy-6-metoxy-1,4-benzoquinol methylase
MEAEAGASFLDRRSFYESRAAEREKASRRFYHRLLEQYYRFLIPPGVRVLEVGCGFGHLLAAVEPSYGVGIDFSESVVSRARQAHPTLTFHVAQAGEFAASEKFDYIILSDLANDLSDVQGTLEWLRQFATPRTRIVLNFFNNLWRPILNVLERFGAKSPTLMQNWLSASDMENLLRLADWELVKQETHILCPARIPVIDEVCNRWLGPLLSPLCLSVFQVGRLQPAVSPEQHYTCSVVIPARNEAGNIEPAVLRTPDMGKGTEIIFIEGHSKDNTWEEIQRVQAAYPKRNIKILKQQSKGKGGAVREAFGAASGDILFILDADLTMPPEQLPKFYEAARSGAAEFVNGVRLVYPMEEEAMQFLNMVANHTFGLLFSWLLGQRIKDTLCGTKVLFRADYLEVARNREYFGDFDPFGDFDLLFGAAKLNLRIVDLPIRYKARTYGETNIHRWRHGWLLLRMVLFAARRIKFI